jgi:thiol-disulfide isomerase/thioredoxin
LFQHYERAIDLILANHRDKELRPVCATVRFSKQSENFLRTLMAEGDSRELRAEACFRLGRLLSQKSEMCLPTSGAQLLHVGVLAKYLYTREKENLDEFLADQDVGQLQSEALRCFELVISEYSDVPAIRGDESLGVRARREVYELKHLTVGAVAPEIAGSDIDGQQMRLSDHRGKVVLLVFWASWCGPCMGDVPHENELHAKFVDRPFAIVGVNTDGAQEIAKGAVQENSIRWRSFWDGEEGPITADWNIRGWPTVYVLDQEGTIRFKHLRGEDLDEPLEQLVTEAEANFAKQK